MINIQKATRDDIAPLVPLFVEMDEHYLSHEAADAQTLRERLSDWFTQNENSCLLVALKKDKALGLATLSPLFPAGSAQTALFLKELYVSKAKRGMGIGTKLLRACAAQAHAIGASRLDLTAEANNPQARCFYERLGAFDTAKTYLRWEPDGIQRLAAGQD
ncbi:MAG: GNAT family N-acetyltransferase [Pseudomonadota bacterium]